MNNKSFDRTSGIPIYRQLAAIIENQIIKNVFQLGDLLPSESELIKEFQVSRTTVRLAMDLLTNAGLIKREQGKGTSVIPRMKTNLPYLKGFTEEAISEGLTPSIQLLTKKIEPCPVEVSEALSIPANTRILKVIRLRLINSKPAGVTKSWFNSIEFPELLNKDFNALSIYSIIEDQLGLIIHSAKDNISADLANADVATLLNINVGDPVLHWKRTTLINDKNEDKRAIEYVEALFTGSMYSVDIELFRQKGNKKLN